jgi:hypothetical protein
MEEPHHFIEDADAQKKGTDNHICKVLLHGRLNKQCHCISQTPSFPFFPQSDDGNAERPGESCHVVGDSRVSNDCDAGGKSEVSDRQSFEAAAEDNKKAEDFNKKKDEFNKRHPPESFLSKVGNLKVKGIKSVNALDLNPGNRLDLKPGTRR